MSPIRRSDAASVAAHRAPYLIIALLLILTVALSVAGCGGGGGDESAKDDVVIATVDDVELTAAYYESRLAKMEESELPRDEQGQPIPTGTLEGKKEFLDTLIKKEVMVLTASKMGFDRDPAVVGARNSLTAYEAGLLMWDKIVEEPANTITHEELDAFYAKMGSSRQCRYLITNFREDAEAARDMALGGADWDDVVDRFHDGDPSPTGVNEISVPYGRYTIDFEDAVFKTEIGGITPVIKTAYGFWVLKVDGEKPGKKPALEEAKAQILDITRNRKISRQKQQNVVDIHGQYDFKIHEDALWVVYQGLPEGETIFKPGTQEPVPQEDLEPLDVKAEDLDMVLYSYNNPEEGRREYTVGDYKAIYDGMSVFQRPKHSEMLGGLRSKLENELNKTLFNFRAKEMGLYEDPSVVQKVDLKIEEMIVHKLYNDLVSVEERVTLEELEAFWAEHSDEYYRNETRSGRLLLARNEAKALEAKVELEAGGDWRKILLQFGTDKDNKSRSGRIEKAALQEGEPLSGALFGLGVGGISDPIEYGDGRFALVILDEIHPGGPVELETVREAVGNRIRNIRKEEAFNALLEKWRGDFTITVHEDKLADLASWEELTAVEVPENLVPRN